MDCKLLPLTPDSWRAYLSICDVRGVETRLQAPPSGVYVGGVLNELPVLISGACIDPVDTRFAVLQGFVTNPIVPLRARYIAAEATLRAARTLATLMARTLVVPLQNGPVSLARFIARRGFRYDQAQNVWYCLPGLPVPVAKKAPRAPLPRGRVDAPKVPAAKARRKGAGAR
jgi:hypothetical protein